MVSADLRAHRRDPHVTQNQAVTKTGNPQQRHRRTDGTRHAGHEHVFGRSRRAMVSAFSDRATDMAHAQDPNIVASLASPPTSCSI